MREPMTISAQIHVDSGDGPNTLGNFRFLALPRAGERILIGEDPADVWLLVKTVTHVPSPDSEEDWDGLIILNCEIDS